MYVKYAGIGRLLKLHRRVLQKGDSLRRFRVILLGMFCTALLCSVTACERSQTVATVGPEQITDKELRDAFKRKADFLGVNSITPEMKKDVLNLRIERALTYLYARDQGMQAQQDRFQEMTREMTDSEKKENLKAINEQLLIEQARQEVLKDVAVTPQDVELYYREHENNFRVPDRYKVYLVKVSEDNADHVLAMARKDPEAFDDMSLNTETAELKQLNKIARLTPKDMFPEEMGPYLEKMKEGDIEGPVQTARGLFLFKLVEKESARVQTLQEVSPLIKQVLLKQKREAKLESWYEQQKKKYPVKVLVKDLVSIDR
jgi:parvulin-like peptidyl-prolyl isomerase